jgi:DNA modification methylase
MDMIIQGDVLLGLAAIKDNSVHCCVTSPPYWGLRDYGVEGQLGLEKTPQEYIAKMVEVFREVRRVLRSDGTAWLNIGDSYAGSWGNSGHRPELDNTPSYQRDKNCEYLPRGGWDNRRDRPASSYRIEGIKAKDLCLIPFRLAIALQEDGWWVRQDIIWHKKAPMPESVKDRCTRAHEYIFLLTKSARYYFDQDAIREPATESSVTRLGQDVENQQGSFRQEAKTNGPMKAVKFGGNKQCPDTRLQSGKDWNPTMGGGGNGFPGHSGNRKADGTLYITANKRSVWTVATAGFKEAHFAVFPEELITPCIKAGCPEGGIVLDPFNGANTTGIVCKKLNRQHIGIEINPEYVAISQRRTLKECGGLF